MNRMILIEVITGRKINESSGMMPPTSLVPSSRGSRATVPTAGAMGGAGAPHNALKAEEPCFS